MDNTNNVDWTNCNLRTDPLNRIVLTNFSKEDLELYQHAILYDRGLNISNQAFDVFNRQIKDTFALTAKDIKDRSEFWRCFDELKRRKKSNIDRWMILPDDFVKSISI